LYKEKVIYCDKKRVAVWARLEVSGRRWRSADFQSAVSPIFNRQRVRYSKGAWNFAVVCRMQFCDTAD
jgi:hypothetical protein